MLWNDWLKFKVKMYVNKNHVNTTNLMDVGKASVAHISEWFLGGTFFEVSF